jgi:hypothetical protein
VELPKKEEVDAYMFLDKVKEGISKDSRVLVLLIDKEEMISASIGLSAADANLLLDKYKNYLIS